MKNVLMRACHIFLNILIIKITFKDNNFKTEVTILNNQVTKFGINKKRKHNIEFSSYDELKIIRGYQRKYPEKLLEIKELN